MRASTIERTANRPSRRRQPAARQWARPYRAAASRSTTAYGPTRNHAATVEGGADQQRPQVVAPRGAVRRAFEPARVVGQLGQELVEEGLDVADAHEREQRARRGGLVRRSPSTSTVSVASPNGRRKTPSTTRTARIRETGTVASLRCTSPRPISSRSQSRITVKPPKAMTAPAVESSQASTSSAAAPSTTAVTVCGSQRTASSPFSGSNSCSTTWKAPARTGRTMPSWPAVSAATASSRPLMLPRREPFVALHRRRGHLRAGGAQLRDRVRRQRGQRDLAALRPRARLDVDREHAEQPLQRPWWTSMAWIRSSRTSVSFVLSSPVWWWIASAPTV